MSETSKLATGECLDALRNARVVTVEVTPDGIRFTERCDDWFAITLSRDDVRQLAAELLALADTP